MNLWNERNRVKWAIAYYVGRTHPRMSERLQALNPETATAKDVADILGSGALANGIRCDECEKYSWDVVEFGPDLSEYTSCICADCMRQALQMIEKG